MKNIKWKTGIPTETGWYIVTLMGPNIEENLHKKIGLFKFFAPSNGESADISNFVHDFGIAHLSGEHPVGWCINEGGGLRNLLGDAQIIAWSKTAPINIPEDIDLQEVFYAPNLFRPNQKTQPFNYAWYSTGIFTLGDLLVHDIDTLLLKRGIGKKTVNIICDYLNSRGLSLAQPLPDNKYVYKG